MIGGTDHYAPKFAPLQVGQKVIWRNTDLSGADHTATAGGFTTGAIGALMSSDPVPMIAAGTVDYRCTFHPGVSGTLKVQ